MISYCWMIKPLDYFVQKASDKEALGDFCGYAARAQIEELVFVDLAGSGAVGATYVVGEDLEAGH